MAACGSRQDDYSRRMIAPFLLLPSILFPANRSRSASPRTTRPGAVDRPAIDLPKAWKSLVAPAVTADVLPRDDRRPIDASPQWRCSGFWGLLPGQPLLARFNWIAPGYIGQCALCF